MNFGFQRYECNGLFYLHLNHGWITILIQHDIDHSCSKKDLDGSLIKEIESMCLYSSPGQIFKELKSKYNPEILSSLTLKQVGFLF